VKKQFQIVSSLWNNVIRRYTLLARNSRCIGGCGNYVDFPNLKSANTRNEKKRMQDNSHLETELQHAECAKKDNYEIDADDTNWSHISQIARTFVPLSHPMGPHWLARNVHGDVHEYTDEYIVYVFSEDYRKQCCSRPNAFIGVWEDIT
jgi:hypothetical protein